MHSHTMLLKALLLMKTVVLILVVMEDALALASMFGDWTDKFIVLILVVMEDALALIQTWMKWWEKMGLNPCCNGRCTRTSEISDFEGVLFERS